MPFLSPVTFLCHQKWDSATAMTKIPQSTPIIMLSGRRDEVVPPEHMDELWKIACENGEKNRMWVTLQNGTHSTSWDSIVSRGFLLIKALQTIPVSNPHIGMKSPSL
jgi:predicted esterase